MKKLYTNFLLFGLLLLLALPALAQCPDGQTGGTTMFDTTIAFGTGVNSRQVKFPKFDPTTGMLRCVRLIVTITGVIDTVAMQNYSASAQTADFYYNRTDQMSGPGLAPSLSNSFNGHYGTYNLTAYDGIPNAGTDFKSLGRDTVLRQTLSRTLSDSTAISAFYGTDSVVYDYSITVGTTAAITGGSSSSLVLTSALVNFRFEYCTCPLATLPLGLLNFSAAPVTQNEALLQWQAEGDNEMYVYDVETSRDGRHFEKVDEVQKRSGIKNPAYRFRYSIPQNQYGRYYFRLKQRWMNGYYKYSEVRTIDFTNPLFASVSLYPNPAQGIAGLKFVNAKAGKYRVHIINSTGQVVQSTERTVAETDYQPLGLLPKGLYYVKLTELSANASTVLQLVVQ